MSANGVVVVVFIDRSKDKAMGPRHRLPLVSPRGRSKRGDQALKKENARLKAQVQQMTKMCRAVAEQVEFDPEEAGAGDGNESVSASDLFKLIDELEKEAEQDQPQDNESNIEERLCAFKNRRRQARKC